MALRDGRLDGSYNHHIAREHAQIHFEEGHIYHRGMTTLVPVKRRPDGRIVWHFEVNSPGAILKAWEIEIIFQDG